MLKNISTNSDNSEDKNLYNIHRFGDDELLLFIKSISEAGKEKENLSKIRGAKKLVRMYEDRIIYKQLERKTKRDLNIDKFDTENISNEKLELVKSTIALNLYHNLIKKGSAFNRLEIEDRICEYLPEMESGDVLIYCPYFNMAMKLAKVKITDERENIFELKDFDDDTTQSECQSILNKHQELWAIQIFINPKYVDENHSEYKSKYAPYEKIVKEYFDWKLFSNKEYERTNGSHFWNSYINFMLPILDIDNRLLGTPKDLNHKAEELVAEFLDGTGRKNTYHEVENAIKEKFNIKINKS